MTQKIGVMVVHGIGDPAPGEALRNLTDALSHAELADGGQPDPRFIFGGAEEKRLASQHPQLAWKPEFVPMFVRRCAVCNSTPQAADPEIVFAETYWGSASQLRAGIFGMVQGLIRLFFRSQVIIAAATEPSPPQSIPAGLRWLLYRIAWGTSRLLTGPIFALNVLLVLVLLVYQYGVPRLAMYNPEMVSVYGGSGLGVGIIALTLWLNYHRPNTMWKHLVRPAWWMLGFMGLWLLWYQGRAPSGVEATIAPLTTALNVFFLLVAGGLLFVIVGRGVHWVMAEFLRAGGNRQGPPLTIALFTLIVQYGLWAVVVPTLWTLLLLNYAENASPKKLYSDAASTDGVQWLALGIVTFGGLLALSIRKLRTQHIIRKKRDQGEAAQSTERLIIHPLMMGPLAIVTLLTVSFILVVSVPKLFGQPLPGFAPPILAWIAQNRATPVVASLIFLVIQLSGASLWLALDLVNDIIDYVAQNGDNARPDDQSARRPFTWAIRPRFRLVLDYLMQIEQINKLVIVAHSQGSVIALDELAYKGNHQLEQYGGQIMLVTIGAPISHLYQHYFPDKYPEWEHPKHWLHLFARVGRWRHYYRIDDFIGTDLQSIPKTLLQDFTQAGISDGAHSDYWQDDRFVQKLHGELVKLIASQTVR